jgi:hypothetical protein
MVWKHIWSHRIFARWTDPHICAKCGHEVDLFVKVRKSDLVVICGIIAVAGIVIVVLLH